MFESLIFLKIISILFIFLTLTISVIIVKLLQLRKKGWNFADIAFPLYAFQFYIVSDKAYYNSLLPHLVLSLTLLATGLALFFLFKKKEFSYKRFFKVFWRAGFILTFLMYLALVIATLTLQS
ncbi:DUF3397 domain-containing protein [Streptococcus suis]|nr:DUF3397 domain-containing protein [Streptococcus suis]